MGESGLVVGEVFSLFCPPGGGSAYFFSSSIKKESSGWGLGAEKYQEGPIWKTAREWGIFVVHFAPCVYSIRPKILVIL